MHSIKRILLGLLIVALFGGWDKAGAVGLLSDNAAQQGWTCTVVTADTAVKSAPGILHTVTFTQNDAAPTAGGIIVYNNTAESGTKLLDWSGITTTVFMPITLVLDATFSTGLYVGFTTTNDVNVTVCYR